MADKNLRVGDTIKVTGYRAGKYPAGVVDDMGTEKLFKSMVGRCYTIRGFDDYGHIELEPKSLHTVWIEPELVELVEDSLHGRNPRSRQRADAALPLGESHAD